jgi:FkbM family methyltransferase
MTSKASGHQVSEAVAARPEGFDADPADVAGEVVTHGTSGLKLSLDRVVANDRIVEEIEAGRYEAEELSISCDYVRPEDRVLELGAGVGFISAGVMRRVGPTFYAAVEADARLIPHIRRTHALNDIFGAKVLNAAFASDPDVLARGSVSFTLHREFWRSGIGQDQPGITETVAVPAVDASAFLAENRINVLIADIEGAELDLLRHLDTAGVERVVLELHPQRFGLQGVAEVFALLGARGFAYDAGPSRGPVVCFRKIGTD